MHVSVMPMKSKQLTLNCRTSPSTQHPSAPFVIAAKEGGLDLSQNHVVKAATTERAGASHTVIVCTWSSNKDMWVLRRALRRCFIVQNQQISRGRQPCQRSRLISIRTVRIGTRVPRHIPERLYGRQAPQQQQGCAGGGLSLLRLLVDSCCASATPPDRALPTGNAATVFVSCSRTSASVASMIAIVVVSSPWGALETSREARSTLVSLRLHL